MRTRCLLLCLFTVCLFAQSCHRPPAYFQPSARESFRKVPAPPAEQRVATTLPADTVPVAPVMPDNAREVPNHVVATARNVVTEPAQRLQQRRIRMEQRLTTPLRAERPAAATAPRPTDRSNATTYAQPRPRPKGRARQETLGNKIRRELGLEPRRQLNWWQRIPWQVKAATIVIVVALVFALLKITLLAIIFGLIGAYLLIRGLKRTFKVRRPIF